ncbi:MAG: GLPGLI family protein [Chitinophagaceae bacterium]|nr:MAG: GLPGLI family protein [Chitinophagaceae bacterium]
MKKSFLITMGLFLLVHHFLAAQEGVIRYCSNIKGSSSSLNKYTAVYFKGGEAVFIKENDRDTIFYTEEGLIARITSPTRNFRCYMNFEKKILLKQRQLVPDEEQNFLITEKSMEIPNWTLSPESKVINNFLCKKASCLSMAGTKTEVWYTEEIPVSVGLVSFCGLPGLILETESIDNDGNIFSTTMVSIKIEEVDMPGLHKTVNRGQLESDEVFTGAKVKN